MTSSAATLTADPAGPPRRPGRLRLTVISLASMLLAVPALILFVLSTVALALVPLGGVGVPILLCTVPATRWACNRQRALAGSGLPEPVRQTYADGSGRSIIGRVRLWGSEAARWRDYGWTLYSSSVGFILSACVVGLLIYPLWTIVWFFLWLGLPDVFDRPYGFLHITEIGQALAFTAVDFTVAVILFLLLTRPLCHLRLRLDALLLGATREEALRRRVAEVTTARDESVDASASELRRVERDLHDGAQARLAALAMSLGLAEELVDKDPAAVRALIAEARANASGALGDIRSVVRGIHPPVLADRGLEEAVRALSVDMSVPITVRLGIGERIPAATESALYFAVAECLANMSKHSGARRGWICTARDGGRVLVEVGDDGRGGAVITGSGLHGVTRRLAALDGKMSLSSPQGGPTVITMEVPCASSSAKTTPSSGTA
ncbi:sensor histidine kinase [Leekyejoonella antrihumi]|uniref:histidine kinase n=1 Tax=Leekyejoonella antrihumi TaxID=1660198 RepID=A0A563DWB5_9MICO|nr:histidine kinase [Leekyejoonella antrihumi]TWP34578.1 sensor histidine kinase [Leekyejoonella antrihumi]